MDTQNRTLQMQVPRKRHRTIQERRAIMEETILPSTSVSRVARRHDVNANQRFYWRKLYREGRLGAGTATPLLPVKVSGDQAVEPAKWENRALTTGMEIKVSKGTIRIAGVIDVGVLRTVLECLAR